MSLFFQLVVSGLTTGAIYAALALALVLIFRATNVVNFGQGEMATFSAYVAWQLMQWGVELWLAVLASLAVAFCIGIATFRLVIRPLMSAPVEAVVVVTLGIFVLFQAMCMWIWGAEQLSFPSLFPDGGFSLGEVRVLASAVGTLAILICIAAAFGFIFRFTRLGLSMRAAAFDRARSVLVGVDVERMLMLGWGFAAVIGAFAAILIAPRLFLSPTMMAPILFYGLAAATLGGWDSPLGAIVGGLAVGVAESLGASYLPFIGADMRIAVPIVLTLAILLVKPVGLFGSYKVTKL
ncbi:branched-chain amino acid ABC transporter permease [Rhizobium sp. NXC24]|uniref:branched-chain amino acid ABC transporter permease n=1 Tax=Rhizobium sp. NXC24 TaxID=2048897 RepID=UPI000CDF4735|nr:branched-chain amino acid ABC transporter permease [Rhizobium sp. NXC24]AVA26151.1 high-affinity branched-chain amino acid ABC transporter permease protein LivH 4 [Rhizobium sp. NXC24]